MSKRKRQNYICLKDIEDVLIEALINKVHIRTEIWDRNNPAYVKNNHESHRFFDEINRELVQEGFETTEGKFILNMNKRCRDFSFNLCTFRKLVEFCRHLELDEIRILPSTE